VLCLRVFRWGWSDQPELRSILDAQQWVDASGDLDLDRERAAMLGAIERCAPRVGARARITRVVTCDASGTEAVRFGSHEPLTLQVSVEGLADVRHLVTGVQVRDMFDRMLWTTRTDWQTRDLTHLRAGERLSVTFHTDRLLLGTGYYQLTVACHEYPREDQLFHWVDGAWKFQVIETPGLGFMGTLDLGWQYVPTLVGSR
jgi:hypothetical protein